MAGNEPRWSGTYFAVLVLKKFAAVFLGPLTISDLILYLAIHSYENPWQAGIRAEVQDTAAWALPRPIDQGYSYLLHELASFHSRRVRTTIKADARRRDMARFVLYILPQIRVLALALKRTTAHPIP